MRNLKLLLYVQSFDIDSKITMKLPYIDNVINRKLEDQLRELREAKDELEEQQGELQKMMTQLEEAKNLEAEERRRQEEEIQELIREEQEIDRERRMLDEAKAKRAERKKVKQIEEAKPDSEVSPITEDEGPPPPPVPSRDFSHDSASVHEEATKGSAAPCMAPVISEAEEEDAPPPLPSRDFSNVSSSLIEDEDMKDADFCAASSATSAQDFFDVTVNEDEDYIDNPPPLPSKDFVNTNIETKDEEKVVSDSCVSVTEKVIEADEASDCLEETPPPVPNRDFFNVTVQGDEDVHAIIDDNGSGDQIGAGFLDVEEVIREVEENKETTNESDPTIHDLNEPAIESRKVELISFSTAVNKHDEKLIDFENDETSDEGIHISHTNTLSEDILDTENISINMSDNDEANKSLDSPGNGLVV